MMKRWCLEVLLVVCLAALMWTGVKADEVDDNCCTYFDMLDDDKDGKLTVKDFTKLYSRFPPDNSLSIPALLGFIDRTITIFQQFVLLFPLSNRTLPEYAIKGPVTLPQFITTLRNGRNGAALSWQIAQLVYFIHRVFNYDADDMILTRHEYNILCHVFSIPAEDTYFSALDLNGDGVVSFYECYSNAIKFFNGPNDANSRFWAGPPKTCQEVARNNTAALPPGA